MQTRITSWRSIPISFDRSSGVRWFAIPLLLWRWRRVQRVAGSFRLRAGSSRPAGEEQVVARAGSVGQVAGRPARDDCGPFDPLRAVREHDRVAPELLTNVCGELVDRHRVCEWTAEPDPPELLGRLDAQL